MKLCTNSFFSCVGEKRGLYALADSGNNIPIKRKKIFFFFGLKSKKRCVTIAKFCGGSFCQRMTSEFAVGLVGAPGLGRRLFLSPVGVIVSNAFTFAYLCFVC